MTFPALKLELNLNTIIMVVGFLVGTVAWGVSWGSQVRDTVAIREEMRAENKRIEDKFIVEIMRIDTRSEQRRTDSENRWRAHDELHKERSTENAAVFGKTDQRIDQLEAATREIDNIKYRTTVLEQGAANTTKAIEELKMLVNNQASDTRVIKQILEQMQRSQGLPLGNLQRDFNVPQSR